MEISNKGQFFLVLFSCSFSNNPHTVQLQTTIINLLPGGQHSRHIPVAVAFALVRPFWKKNYFWSVNVFSTKVLIEDTILCLLLETGRPFYVVIRLASSHKDRQRKFLHYIRHFEEGKLPLKKTLSLAKLTCACSNRQRLEKQISFLCVNDANKTTMYFKIALLMKWLFIAW